MISPAVSSFETLAAGLESQLPDGKVELTRFPSGGAMLDVRRSDQRAFVLAYSPTQGYGVDEVKAADGFVNSYRFAYPDFDPAAEKLKELVASRDDLAPRLQSVALNLVVIQARDLEITREFYNALGLSLQPEQHGRGPRHYAAELGATVFEIYPCGTKALVGHVRIGFQVPSLHAAIAALQRQSAKVVTEPHDSAWGRRAVVEDPDGNRVELVER